MTCQTCLGIACLALTVAAAGAQSTGALGGSTAGLASAATAFSKLGLKPDMVGKAVPVLTGFVSKSAGPQLGSLLADALK